MFGRNLYTTRHLALTFAGAGVVQVESVSSLGALQATFSREEVAGRVVRVVVRPAHLRGRERTG